MNNEISIHQPSTDLAQQMKYAEVISTGAMLPAAYRGKPADILIATGLGNAIGIAPAQALYEIYIVNGRPSPSANLMAALVRRAGHKLRIEGDTTTCTATLIRADDPEFPMSATWTIEQARAANLTGKDTWKQYPSAMLRARAIAEVVRMGAPEAVMGMEYAREEVEQFDTPATPAAKPQGMAGLRAAVQPERPAEPVEHPQAETGEAPSEAQRKRMFALFAETDLPDGRTTEGRETRLAYCSDVVGREVTTSNDLTAADVSAVIDALERDQQSANLPADADPGAPWPAQDALPTEGGDK